MLKHTLDSFQLLCRYCEQGPDLWCGHGLWLLLMCRYASLLAEITSAIAKDESSSYPCNAAGCRRKVQNSGGMCPDQTVTPPELT